MPHKPTARRCLHFALLGGLLFAAGRATTPALQPDLPVITATSAAAADNEILLREAFAARLDETDKVVRERLVALGRNLNLAAPEDAAALEREARALGLHQSDPLIRRHLIDMMRLAAANSAIDDDSPDDATRRALYDADPSLYALPARVSFTQVFLSRARRGARIEADAQALLTALRADRVAAAAAAGHGDPFVRGARVDRAAAAEIARIFGAPFAQAVFSLAVGEWSGPLASPYGLHMVYVHEQTPARPADFSHVRARLLDAYRREQSQRRVLTTLAALRDRYEIRIADGES